MSRVSLLPVENVDESAVLKVPVPASELPGFVLKSRAKDDAVKPGRDAAGKAGLDAGGVALLKKLSQSKDWMCAGLPKFVVVLAAVSPSSWKFRSCTACAPPARKSARAIHNVRGNGKKRKRDLRLLPVGPRIFVAIWG